MNILNSTAWTSRFLNDKDLPTEQYQILRRIIHHYYNQDQRYLDYTALSNSKHWKDVLVVSNALNTFDIAQLTQYEDQLAFWLNTFNLLMIHGICKSSYDQPLKEDSKFFSETAYQIGEDVFTLDDIEHGILRANGTKFGAIGRYFKKGEARIQWVLHKLDPRIHFCLYSACKSSPPLAAFKADTIMQQLNTQTTIEISEQVQFDANKLSVPKTLKWYKNDFGSKDQLLEFIANHSNDILKLNIQSNLPNIDVKYTEFDWSLKKAFS